MEPAPRTLQRRDLETGSGLSFIFVCTFPFLYVFRCFVAFILTSPQHFPEAKACQLQTTCCLPIVGVRRPQVIDRLCERGWLRHYGMPALARLKAEGKRRNDMRQFWREWVCDCVGTSRVCLDPVRSRYSNCICFQQNEVQTSPLVTLNPSRVTGSAAKSLVSAVVMEGPLARPCRPCSTCQLQLVAGASPELVSLAQEACGSKADVFVLAPQLLDEFCMDSGRLMSVRPSVRTFLGGSPCATW